MLFDWLVARQVIAANPAAPHTVLTNEPEAAAKVAESAAGAIFKTFMGFAFPANRVVYTNVVSSSDFDRRSFSSRCRPGKPYIR